MAQADIHILTKRELATDPRWDRWYDPDAIATILPVKRKALLENPFAGGDDDPIQLVGTLDGRVVGRLDLVGGALDVLGEHVRCYWGSALYVPEEFRKTLMGVKLILAMQRMHHTVGASGVSRLVYPLYRNLRWLDFELPRYVLVRHSRSVVERYVGAGLAGASARAIADTALRAHGMAIRPWARHRVRRFDAQQISEFPEALAPTLRVSGRAVSGHRSAAWMNWLLRSHFDEQSTRRGLFTVIGPNNEISGYFLVRARTYERITERSFRNLYLGSLQDWAALDPTLKFEHMTLLAVRELAKWNVDAIEVFVPDDESSAGLRRLGFVRAGSMYVLANASEESPLRSPQFATPSAWRVRPAEGESFFS